MILFWSTIHQRKLPVLCAFLPLGCVLSHETFSFFFFLSPLQLSKATTMRGSLPIFTLLGKLADTISVFADILVVKHSE